MLDLYQSRVLYAGNYNTQNVTRRFVEQCSHRNSSLQYQVMPLQSAVTNLYSRILIYISCTVFLSLFVLNIVDISNIGIKRFKQLRLTVETRDSDELGTFSFGVFSSGCEVNTNQSVYRPPPLYYDALLRTNSV